MKQKLLHFFAVFVALVMAIPIANAQSYSIETPTEISSVSYESVTTESNKPNSNYKQIAVVGDRIYTAAGAQNVNTYLAATSTYHTKVWITDLSGKTFTSISAGGPTDNTTTSTIFPYETTGTYFHLGPACAADSDGTLWFVSHRSAGASGWYSDPGAITYCIGSTTSSLGTTKVGITLGKNAISARADVMSAYGPCTSGTGYIWFAPNGLAQLDRLTITEKSVKQKDVFNAPAAPGAGVGYAKQFSANRILWQKALSGDNTGEIQIGTINESAKTITWEPTGLTVHRNGVTGFNLGDREIIAYSSSKTNITLYDYTNKVELYTITPFTSVSTQSWVCHSMDVKVSGNTATLIVFVPGVGAKKYTITATATHTDPVTNMQVQTGSGMPYSAIVNWNAPSGEDTPSKYAVSYSTDGGTSWSTAVETTSLSYTYSGLTQGEYIFKVTPYYGSAAGEATTQAATVYGVTTPVSTVNVAYYNNTGNSVAVTWTVPATNVAPQKYQVSYSADGGSTWSTAVETTDLAYTFSNLPVGTYTFKVTPIYNGVAGESALSESINSLAPSGYTFTTSKRWEVRGTWGTDAAPDGRSIAVSNNMMYVASPNTDTKIAYISQGTSSTSWPKFETGFAKQNYGLGMDNDDAGNIIMSSGTYFGSSGGFAQFTIYPAGATSNASKVDIALEGDYLPGSRCDFIAAQGNLLSSAGGYVWLAPNAGQKIMRIKIANGTLAGITTWTQTMSSTTNTNQIVLRPLDDGRLYFHLRGSGYKIITLPAAGEEITADMVETIPATGYAFNPYSNVNSDMFTLLGYNFHVRNDGAEAQSIGVEIKNLTDVGNGDAAFTPFEGKTPADGNSSVTKMNGYGSLVRAVNVDEYTTDVYCYTINHGVTVYRVTASPVYTVTGAIKSLDYEYTTVETEEGTRQDVVLSWEAPEEATPTSYKIYYNTGDDKELVATVAAPALTYTDKNVNANHTYTVIPYFAGVAEDEALGLSVTTTEVQTVLFAPIITEMRSYDGYSIAQFFFKMPSLSKVKPASYNVYRDGILLESGITQLNFIDDDLPKIEKEVEESHDYVYTVEAVYSSTYDNATRMSEGKIATVTYRDWSLAGYLLQDVYNVPINQALGNMPVNFTNYEYYRQGHFYNGSWYIAERADALSKKDQDKANGDDKSTRSEIESDDANATGGVVVFGATNEVDVRAGMVGKVITNDAFESIGLAIDDYGTIFVRNNNLDKLAATAPNDGNPTQIKAYPDGFTRRITEGALYQLKDGAYPSEPSAIVDLSALWTDNRFIDDMVFSSGKSNGQVAGRSDYYNMYGDVMSAEGGYLILSPSWTRTIFKVKIVNGVYDSHEVLEFSSSYTEENSYTGKIENHNILTGTENYGFKIAGRDAWMAQIRSNGYFGIHGVEEGHEGEEHEHEWHAIFNTESRINNSGGTSILAFDNPLTTEVNDGETFLITPACMYSRNQGDFIVTRGIKGAIDEDVADSKLSPPMPVAQYKQETQNTNVATNANGNWFHAETGKYESVSGVEEECVYIYQYVPGVRFAKYRLVPDNQLPVVYPTLTLATAYNDNNNKTEITHFNGVSTWNRPNGFGDANPENSRVWIESYTYQLLDPNGKKIYETEIPEQYNEDGTPVTSYSISTELMDGKTDSIAFNNYTARVAVNYKFATGSTQQSVFNLAIANNDYPAEPATGLGVWVFKQDNRTVGEWVEKDGEWVVVYKEQDAYRVEIDFDEPDFSNHDSEEPVSNYTVYAIPTINGAVTEDTIPLTGFELHKGSEVVNGVTRAICEITDQIPGTYDFENSKAPYYSTGSWSGGESHQNVVLTWHHVVDNGTYNEETLNTRSVKYDEPHMWKYYVVANYAASNEFIRKPAEAVIETDVDDGLIGTGVEVVGNDGASSLQIYPIPACTSITIKSGETINTIVICNESGAEVMNIDGNGDTITNVNVENLVAGFYFVKINNQAPVKIIKK